VLLLLDVCQLHEVRRCKSAMYITWLSSAVCHLPSWSSSQLCTASSSVAETTVAFSRPIDSILYCRFYDRHFQCSNYWGRIFCWPYAVQSANNLPWTEYQWPVCLRGPSFTLFTAPPSLFFHFLSFPSPLLSFPLPLGVGPLNIAMEFGERCKLSQWCILALKSDMWWHQENTNIVILYWFLEGKFFCIKKIRTYNICQP